VLFIGRLCPVKGIELLFDAFAIILLCYPDTLLVVAGAGEECYIQKLRAHALKLGIADDIVWTGFLDKAGKAAALADADVFVAPSQSESFGLAAVEALGAGVPSVISDGVGIADEVSDAEAALVVPPDAVAIANGIECILQNYELGFGLASRARALVRARYGPDAVAAQVMRLYAEIGCRS